MQGPFSRRSRRKLASDINVVPFIDVMLVLLVIFMITAPMMNQGVNVDLPKASATPVDESKPAIVVSVDSDGRYYVGQKGHDQLTTLGQLGAQVQDILKDAPGSPVMVRGDSHVAYGDIVVLMATLQRAGVPNVGLLSAPAGKP